MADITIAVADVARVSGDIEIGTAGATVTAGAVVYLDSATNTYKLADNATVAKADAKGIALHGSLSGQPLQIQTGGDITIGGTVSVGEIYMVSDNSGGVAPEADVGSTDVVTVLGVGISATVITLNIDAYGVTI